MADKVFLENVEIGFKNFRGLEKDMNNAGDRNFLVFLTPEVANDMQLNGWPVKELKPRNPEDEPGRCLKAKVKYRYDQEGNVVSPRIWMVTEHGRTLLKENTVGRLDTSEIKTVDVELTPYNWSKNGRTGVSAYVSRMVVYVVEDKFESKYYTFENDQAEEEDLPF